MAVHLPLSKEAQDEAWNRMLSSKNIIKPSINSVNAGPELFINVNGPSNISSNDIYIDCQPTDSSGEIVKVSATSSSSESMNDLALLEKELTLHSYPLKIILN